MTNRSVKKKIMKKKTIALALSGGGNRGAIHVGVLHAFDVNDIKIDAISGTSAGAIVGAMYSAGYSALDLKKILQSQRIGKMLHFSLKKTSIANMNGLLNVLETHLQNSYESLERKVYICASNMDDARFEIFSSGDLFTHICASACVPILFEPVLIDNKHYIDGGLFNNLPVNPLIGNYDTIIGVHVNNYKIEGDYTIKTIATQIFSSVIKENVKRNMPLCDYLINPELDKSYRIFSRKNTELLFEIGFQAGMDFLTENKFI